MYKQEPPFCVQVELTEGCNLRCSFCGINGIRGKQRQFKFMSLKTVIRITNLLRQSKWLSRVEFAMHGEPSLHPRMMGILQLFRRKLPRRTHLMMSSNGAGFVGDPTSTIDQALNHLNVLALEDYDGVKLIPRILAVYDGVHYPIPYPKDRQGNPHRRRSLDEHDLVVVQDIAKATYGTHASLNNHAGCAVMPNDRAAGKRCAKPFREMSIRWNGSVALCCNDWRGVYQIGNVLGNTLEGLWQSAAFRAARRKLYHGRRDFGPCQGCDALSYRSGLLPDKKGRLTLSSPSIVDERVIHQALVNRPYTKVVLRPWEK